MQLPGPGVFGPPRDRDDPSPGAGTGADLRQVPRVCHRGPAMSYRDEEPMDKGAAYRLGYSDYVKGNAPNPQRVPEDVSGNYWAGWDTAKSDAECRD